MTAGSLPERALPHGDTVDGLRQAIGRSVQLAERRAGELIDARATSELSDAEALEHRLATAASQYGWATLVLLGWVAQQHGQDAGHAAAALVEQVCAGGAKPYCADIKPAPRRNA